MSEPPPIGRLPPLPPPDTPKYDKKKRWTELGQAQLKLELKLCFTS